MTNIFNKKLFSIFIFIFFANHSYSLDINSSEFCLFEEIPVVFSASKIKEKMIDASSAISVITSEDFNQWGIVDLPDAFSYVPGIDVTAVNGRTWWVRSRGFNDLRARRVLVLLDGMSVYTPIISEVAWSYLPLIIEDIDRVEIVRGANDTLYGFNAFDGVINIITKEPKKTKGFLGKYIYGNYGKSKFIGRYGDNINLNKFGNVDFRISYTFDESQGYGDNLGKEFSDKKQVYMVTSRTKYTLNDFFNLDFLFGKNFGEQNDSPEAYFESVDHDRYVDFEFELLKLNFNFSEDHNAFLQFSHLQLKEDEYRSNFSFPLWDSWESQYDIEFQDNFSLFDGKSQTVIGAFYRHAKGKSFLVRKKDFESDSRIT